MKKFFSLVLALVMALSLTTVAWGATDLQDAITAATDGVETTVTLTANTTESITIPANKVIKLDLGAYTLTSASTGAAPGMESSHATITVEAGATLTVVGTGTVDNIYHGGAALWNKGGTVVLNGGTFTRSNENGINWPHTPESERNTSYTVWNQGTMTVNAGVSIVNGAGTASAVANEGTLTFNGGSVTAGRIAVNNEATGTLTITGGTFSSTGMGSGPAAVRNSATAEITGGTFTATSPAVAVLNKDDGVPVSTVITAGTFSSDVSAYVAPGYSFVGGAVVNNAGQFNTLTGSTGIAGTTGKWGATLEAAVADTTYSAVMQNYAPAVPAVKSFPTYGLIVTHIVNKTVNTYGPFVKVPTALNADYVFVSGSSIVYLDAVPATNQYDADATAVKVAANTALLAKCGEVYVDSAAEAGTYYLYDDEYYEEVTPAQKEKVFNVNGVVVYAAKTDKVNVQDHAYKYDTVQTNATTAAKAVSKVYCSACNKTFSFVDGTVADAVKAFGAGNFEPAVAGVKGTIYVRTGYTVPVGTVVTPGTTTGTTTGNTVQSAQTFDAGIAMYVGMSVMAAAGSAVVIGKKKD